MYIQPISGVICNDLWTALGPGMPTVGMHFTSRWRRQPKTKQSTDHHHLIISVIIQKHS